MNSLHIQFAAVALFLALVGTVYALTALWLLRALRRAPARNAFERLFQRRVTGAALLTLAVVGAGCMVYGFTLAPARLRVTRYEITTPKFPAGQRLRLVHLADLHVREHGPREKRLPGLVRGLEPDIILHTGDLFALGGHEKIVAPLLESWDTPQYATRGNLDVLGDYAGVIARAGVRGLDADTERIEVRGLPVAITGIASGREEAIRPLCQALPKDAFNIVLHHHPQGFPETWDTPADVMLAGHTHGGQVCVPGIGALITFDRYWKRYEAGRFHEHGVQLIVSRGVGCEPGVREVRFWCPPEVVVIDVVGRGA